MNALEVGFGLVSRLLLWYVGRLGYCAVSGKHLLTFLYGGILT